MLPDRRVRHIRPFKLIGVSAMNEAVRRLTGAVETWRADWGLDDLSVDVECLRAWETSRQQRNALWQLRYAAERKSARLAWQPEFLRFLQRQMFPVDQRYLMQPQGAPSLAAEGAEAAMLSLPERIARALTFPADCSGIPDTAADENAFAVASGALLARVHLGEHTVSCLMDHECVDAIAGNEAPKPLELIRRDSLNKTMGGIPVKLPIEIGREEVDLASLLTLAVGDVIRLDASIDHPLTVRGPGQEALFDAHLGTLEGQIAVEVVRRSNLDV